MLTAFLSKLLIVIGTLGLDGISKANEALKTVFEDSTKPINQIAEINSRNLHHCFAIAGALLDPTPAKVNQAVADIEANVAAINKFFASAMSTWKTADEAQLAKQLAQDRTLSEGLSIALQESLVNDRLDIAVLYNAKPSAETEISPL